MWIDTDDIDADCEGAEPVTGFLVEVAPERGGARYTLRARPGRTNSSHVPRFRGWLGTTDNVARHADGLACVVGYSRNKDRARLKKLDLAAAAAWLENNGWPELIEGST